MIYQFGSGNLFGLTTVGGVLVPRKFGALQDVSVDFNFSLKELYGQFQFPLAIARGQAKITCKAKYANINAAQFNDLFFGQTLATLEKRFVSQESGTVTATLVTVANSATWFEDMGVTYKTGPTPGVPLTRVPSAPTVGQYSVAAGVYTFNASDNGVVVFIDYTYSPASGGSNVVINNLLVGTSPFFAAVLPILFNGKYFYLRLNSCLSSKLSLATKIEDFIVPEFDFIAAADASNVVGTFTSTE